MPSHSPQLSGGFMYKIMINRNAKGQFIKGHKTNVGKICLKETKNKIGSANKISVKNYYKSTEDIRKKNHMKYMVLQKCLICGKNFWAYKRDVKNGMSKYCCRKCFGEREIKEDVRIRIGNTLRKERYNIKCKICGKQFLVPLSGINRKYCSSVCQYSDKELLRMNGIKSIIKQLNKKGLNKLELAGRRILQDIGVEFQEQVPMFNKFLVDILILNKKLIIQWDGEYWHSKKKNKVRDKSSDAYFKKCGYDVLRITDKEIKNDIHDVYNIIIKFVK